MKAKEFCVAVTLQNPDIMTISQDNQLMDI